MLSCLQSTLCSEKHFKVVIPSYNNESWCEKNLFSILDQHYSNYKILYINDCSTDRTLEKVEAIKNTHPLGHKITIINNTLRGGPLRNVYMPINFLCDDDDLVIILDGDDWLEGTKVLSSYNELFTQRDLWFVYGNYRRSNERVGHSPDTCIYGEDKIGSPERTPVWVKAPRVFYAWVFKLIKLESLLYQGEFLPAAGDAGLSYPLLELSGRRQYFNKNVVYVYNRDNPISHFATIKQFEVDINTFVMQQKPYRVCEGKPIKYNHSTIGAFIVLKELTSDLEDALVSFNELRDMTDTVYILYDIEKVNYDRLKEITDSNPSLMMYACNKDYATTIHQILKTDMQNVPEFIFVSYINGFLKNKEQLTRLVAVTKQATVHVTACASVASANKNVMLPLKHASHVYGNLFSMQLAWQPQLPLAYSIEGLLYPVSEFMNNEDTPLFTDELELMVQGDEKVKTKAGFIALNNWE